MQRVVLSHILGECWVLIVIWVMFCATLGLTSPEALALHEEVAKFKLCAGEGGGYGKGVENSVLQVVPSTSPKNWQLSV